MMYMFKENIWDFFFKSIFYSLNFYIILRKTCVDVVFENDMSFEK